MSLFGIACVVILILVVPLYIFNGFIDEVENFIVITIYNVMGIIFLGALATVWICLIVMAIDFFKNF